MIARVRKIVIGVALATSSIGLLYACRPTSQPALSAGDAAMKVYVPPGQHDEYYAFLSGGFSGQIGVYGLPSGRLLKVIGVYSQNPETGYGCNEETKPMFETSYGFVPWDDTHHTELSQTNGMPDGRWLFVGPGTLLLPVRPARAARHDGARHRHALTHLGPAPRPATPASTGRDSTNRGGSARAGRAERATTPCRTARAR
jgi:hypothetical protein